MSRRGAGGAWKAAETKVSDDGDLLLIHRSGQSPAGFKKGATVKVTHGANKGRLGMAIGITKAKFMFHVKITPDCPRMLQLLKHLALADACLLENFLLPAFGFLWV